MDTITTPGVCNVCARQLTPSEQLTKEHVPARKAAPFLDLHRQTLIKRFGDSTDGRPRRIEQKGVWFKNDCGDCNNRLFGTHYDPAYIDFVKSIERIATVKLIAVHDTVEIEVQPIAVIKGLLGHLMAARGDVSESNYDRLWRDTVLDINAPIPDSVHVYYWFYPYSDRINIFRDVAVRTKDADGKTVLMPCSFISCFPIGFLVSELPAYEGLLELTSKRNLDLKDKITVPLRLADNFQPDWPVHTEAGTFMLFGQSGLSSVSAEKRSKKSS